eukprot:Platyproteum_vivax@DN5948_c0_g1_i2.p1
MKCFVSLSFQRSSNSVRLPKLTYNYATIRSYYFNSAKSIIPHPQKKDTGGDDAAFCGIKYLGVADGVSSWKQHGVQSGLYSRELLQRVQDSLEARGEKSRFTPPPIEVLKEAYTKTSAIGTTTVCLVFIDEYTRQIRSANVGDCSFLIYRPRLDEVVFKSEVQLYDMNYPRQLGTGSHDLPEHADIVDFDVRHNDWIVLASDGLWDNLFVPQVIELLEGGKVSPSHAAKSIAKQALTYAKDANWKSPFCHTLAAYSGQQMTGGKLDDIAVVVAQIKDPKQTKKEKVPEYIQTTYGMNDESSDDEDKKK